MNVLLLSPFHGGSHQSWAEGLQRHCSTKIRLLTLPDRFWKWRMHGGGISLAQKFLKTDWKPDLILATDMLDLSSFLALTRKRTFGIPILLYCHENQLTYPMPNNPEGNRNPGKVTRTDHHYPFINLVSMLTADQTIFNSNYHRREFFNALPNYLNRFPDFKLGGSARDLSRKSRVIYPGIETGLDHDQPRIDKSTPPLFLWNQRWEYDKNPEEFFQTLIELKSEKIEFRVAVCGKQFQVKPREIIRALEILETEIIHRGYAEETLYRRLLRNSDLVFSTAHHEFFGISILEAVVNRTFPILPNRLSYPELLPEEFHRHCLYRDKTELKNMLRMAISDRDNSRAIADRLGTALSEKFSWPRLAAEYDLLFQEFAGK